jgi:hypothetical protein
MVTRKPDKQMVEMASRQGLFAWQTGMKLKEVQQKGDPLNFV